MSTIENIQLPALSPMEAVEKWYASATSIQRDFQFLERVLDTHEAMIHKRWLKKTKEQPRAIPLSAWGPEMPQFHRPDWSVLEERKKTGRPCGRDYKANNALMWPYINQEDLIKPRSLLLFLASRGRNHPAEFAAADLEAMHLGVSIKFIGIGHLPGYVMMFSDRRDIGNYGESVRVDTLPPATERSLVEQGTSVNEGLLILGAQEKTLNFLTNCSSLILHDISTWEIITNPPLPAPASSLEVDTGFASLETMAAEAPYRLPAKIDFGRIVSLLGARRD